MTPDVETIVVGAGVVGLAIARALSIRGYEVLVLEQHGAIGHEVSSRNSEVIHAGLYYAAGSLRGRFCVAGKALLYEFCEENAVTYNACGKLLVATSAGELPKLEAVQKSAVVNGVTDLKRITREEAVALEPELTCVAACLSPSTGVVDSHGLMAALEGHVASRGGQVVLSSRVAGISRNASGQFALEVFNHDATTTITCAKLVLSAGLHASVLGNLPDYPGSYAPPKTYPAKGHYFTLSGPAPFSRLIYPMPDGAWLGVHQTLDVGGQTKFGPDIRWMSDASVSDVSVSGVSVLDYGFEDTDARRETFAREIARYYPGLDKDRLQPGYTGIRPKIYRKGEPVADFAIHGRAAHGIDGLVALYGMESPGLTSCLAIGEFVAAGLKL